MERVVIIGSSGSGKTTLARALADQTGLPHIELDAIFHQPGWVPRPADEFVIDLERRMAEAGDQWIQDGTWEHADVHRLRTPS